MTDRYFVPPIDVKQDIFLNNREDFKKQEDAFIETSVWPLKGPLVWMDRSM